MAGRFSHAIRKLPRRGDFRVQEEHGAAITAAERLRIRLPRRREWPLDNR